MRRTQNNAPTAPAAEESADGDDEQSQGRGRQRNQASGPGAERRRVRDRDREDDVLIPIAGILDVLDNYAFVRITGYLPGASDVYVSLVPGQEVKPAQGRRRRRRHQAAARGRAVQPPEVQRAGQGRRHQRAVGRRRRRACRFR
ncbi:hypothetical protein [Microbacterium laevaniformans]|uniref:hypothetical protein n=1 Tax=Microbacterium laevaniformans TaxID=36807 RepID=UPI0031F0FF1F